MTELYDRIGRGYATLRKPDPRIYRRLRSRFDGYSSVLNVGAGAGSYEPVDLSVYAVEPSQQMIAQRLNRTNVVQGKAEDLPFKDNSFDASMAVLTIHHWEDKRKGLEECARVARRQISLVTWDPESEGFWLVHDYFPELLAIDRTLFPTMRELRCALGRIVIEPLLIPADCEDGFLGAYWRRPSAYLNSTVRSGMSSFARIPDVASRLAMLKHDLATGAWHRKYGFLLSAGTLDIGYRLLTVTIQ